MPTVEQVARYKATRNAKRRERYASDPEYKARRLSQHRQPTPEQVAKYRATRNARRRERYANDPAFRAKVLAGSKKYAQRLASEKEQ